MLKLSVVVSYSYVFTNLVAFNNVYPSVQSEECNVSPFGAYLHSKMLCHNNKIIYSTLLGKSVK